MSLLKTVCGPWTVCIAARWRSPNRSVSCWPVSLPECVSGRCARAHLLFGDPLTRHGIAAGLDYSRHASLPVAKSKDSVVKFARAMVCLRMWHAQQQFWAASGFRGGCHDAYKHTTVAFLSLYMWPAVMMLLRTVFGYGLCGPSHFTSLAKPSALSCPSLSAETPECSEECAAPCTPACPASQQLPP